LFQIEPTYIKGLRIRSITQKPKDQYVKEFYKNYYDPQYYDPRYERAYFVSSDEAASLYGIKKDTSNIIYTTIPDNNDVANRTTNHKYIYPLYYIPGTRGTNIEYKLKKDLYLLNIDDPKTIRLLWNIIVNLEYTETDKEEGFDRASLKELLVETCAEAMVESPTITVLPNGKTKKTWGERMVMPTKCMRFSKDDTDKKLVIFFQSRLAPFLKKRKVHIDGWISYKTDREGQYNFHDEILLLSNKHLDFHSTREVKPTNYNDIPTLAEINARATKDRKKGIIYIPSIDEYKVLMVDKRKDNTMILKKNTVLHLWTFKKPKRCKNLGSTKRGLGMNSFLIFNFCFISN